MGLDRDPYPLAVRFLPLAAEIADRLPARYAALADRLRRASLSIPLHIAAGSAGAARPKRLKFYAVARARALECGAIIGACLALALIERGQAVRADTILTSTVRMLSEDPPVPREPRHRSTSTRLSRPRGATA